MRNHTFKEESLNIAELAVEFERQKNSVHPVTGKKLSKRKRMDFMYDVVTNSKYNKNYSKEEKLFALSLIKKIIEE